ncbi:MAG TPA: outer membrane beta-barrel protein, partial [Thermoanaerobaculia bacterium]|nr:outer membrane beta-barrel protein [Thermoanaerobaculia bacterium]
MRLRLENPIFTLSLAGFLLVNAAVLRADDVASSQDFRERISESGVTPDVPRVAAVSDSQRPASDPRPRTEATPQPRLPAALFHRSVANGKDGAATLSDASSITPDAAAHPAADQTNGGANMPPITPAEPVQKPEPFAFADFTWLNGNSRQHKPTFDYPAFTGELRVDTNYVYDLNHPKDHTLVGSSELGRTGEAQVQQFGIGGDFHYDNVRARLLTQYGMYSTMTPRNDASPARGQWDLANAYRYVSEAYGGYHFDKMNGINVDAGIFMSYVGLFSYYQYDNWAYQPSYVSSNTPWFFNGVRIQIFPNDHFKEEIWLTNGWQSYGMFNDAPGIGSQTLWRPNGNWSFLSNNYFYGKDTLGNKSRKRAHSDSSVEWKYRDAPSSTMSKSALSFTFDIGCEYGGGVSCTGGSAAKTS